jgi:hypothetical protein
VHKILTKFKKRKRSLEKSLKSVTLRNFITNFKKEEINRNNNRFIFKKFKNLELGYTKNSRSFYLDHKLLFKEIFNLCNPKFGSNKYILNLNGTNFIIKKRMASLNNKIHQGQSHTNIFVVEQVRFGEVLHKYFVKEVNGKINSAYDFGRDGFRESIAQNILKDLGLNVVPVQCCICNKKTNQSFIVYDYKRLDNVAQLFIKDNGKIVYKNQIFVSKDFENLCLNLQKQVNEKLDVLKGKYKLDVYDYIDDITLDNLFIDLKKGKLYIFDAWLNNSHRFF